MVTINECNCINSSINVFRRSINLECDALHVPKYEGEEKENILNHMEITAKDLSRNIEEFESNCPVYNIARDPTILDTYKKGKDLLNKFLNNPEDIESARHGGRQVSYAVDIGIRNYLLNCV